ncbi:MAG: YdcF family protein [Acidimicrobiales bacterium]
MAGRGVAPIEDRVAGRSRRRLRWALVLVGLLVFYVVATFVDVWLASRQHYEGSADAVVVLGAAQYNGTPSPVLQARLDHAAELYFAGLVDVVVVTGGNQEGDVTTEAKAGYDYLRVTAQIPDDALLLEVDGHSTYESLRATARFLEAREVNTVILVTDPYHAKRSLLIAAEVGLDAEVSPTSLGAPLDRLVEETVAVAVGRIVGFRRLDNR